MMKDYGPISIVETPRFGVCEDEISSKFICAISEASCIDTVCNTYKAPYETNLSCNAPETVEIGRCRSEMDDQRCASSLVSCGAKPAAGFTNDILFDSYDPSCSLVADSLKPTNADDRRTTYPACANLDKDVWQCVLDEKDCLSGERLTYAKWASEWGPHPCRCEDVPIGICYEVKPDATSTKLTPQNSFCAVTARDCPITHGWMSARAFMANERTTYDCRLCDETLTSASGTPASYFAGACFESGELATTTTFDQASFVTCALESIDCPLGSTGFVSAPRLLEQALRCPIERTPQWGYCSGGADPVECTNKAASCKFDFTFDGRNDCDIHGNAETGIPTYFPHCEPRSDNTDPGDIRCVWDVNECLSSEEVFQEARLPTDELFRGCTCENVFTGVCKEPSTGEYHCAVSPSGCTDPNSYVPQRSLKDRGIDSEQCQLCAPASRPSPPGTAATENPDSPPVFPPTTSTVTVAPVPLPTVSPTGTATAPPVPVVPPTFSQPSFFKATDPPVPKPPTRAPVLPTTPVYPPTFVPATPPSPYPTFIETQYPTYSQKYYDEDSLPMGAVAGLAVGGVVVCALVVVIYTMLTGVGTMRPPPLDRFPEENAAPTEDPFAVITDPNHDQELVSSDAVIT